MLQEQRIGIDGVYTFDKVQVAIDRLRAFEALAIEYSPEGYYLCDSGGKDSSVIKELAIMAGVKHGIHHNHTTLDYPETVYFIRREKARYEAMGIPYTIHYPAMSFPRLMRKKKMPPTRLKRYCCKVLKEHGGRDRVCVTGVRWSESVSRSKQRGVAEVQNRKSGGLTLLNDNDESRKEFETCQIKGKRVVNPIIDWTDDDVWEFIAMRNLTVNPLYAMGYKRVGCVGCPMSSKAGEALDAMPKYKANWIRWFGHLIEDAKRDGRPVFMGSAEDYYNFWISGKALPKDDGQISFDDEEDDDGI